LTEQIFGKNGDLTEQIFGKNGDLTEQIFGKMVIRRSVIQQIFIAPRTRCHGQEKVYFLILQNIDEYNFTWSLMILVRSKG